MYLPCSREGKVRLCISDRTKRNVIDINCWHFSWGRYTHASYPNTFPDRNKSPSTSPDSIVAFRGLIFDFCLFLGSDQETSRAAGTNVCSTRSCQQTESFVTHEQVCVCACVRACWYACVDVCVCACVRACVCAGMRVWVGVYVCVCVCLSLCAHWHCLITNTFLPSYQNIYWQHLLWAWRGCCTTSLLPFWHHQGHQHVVGGDHRPSQGWSLASSTGWVLSES